MNLLEKAYAFIEQNKDSVNKTYRPKFHLAPEIGWMNDPNGFVYFRGEYHLFYQANPYDSKWDTMHWGHAKSKDLVNWEYLPIALAPDQPYDENGCFSGSAIVVDDEIVLMYTGVYEENGIVNQVQCIAKSTDGITFEKYVNNPVIDQTNLGEVGTTVDFRDPKIFKRGDTYYSVVASKTLGEEQTQGQIFIFTSEDTVNWSKAFVLLEGNEALGNIWECPDLIEIDGQDVLVLSPMNMPQEGDKYQNLNSSIAIFGKMNWDTLSLDISHYHEIDHGLDYYAPQTCQDDQGRTIIIAWQQMWNRTSILDENRHGWSGMMTFPRVLSVDNDTLIQTLPVEFYEKLTTIYESEGVDQELVIDNDVFDYLKINSETEFEDLQIRIGNDKEFKIDIIENVVMLSREGVNPEIQGEATYNHEREMNINSIKQVEVLVDASSIEIIVDGKTMSNTVYFDKPVNKVTIRTKSDETKRVVLGKIN